MSTSKLINYTTRDFLSENELELYLSKQDEIYTPGVIAEFKKSGLLRRVVTKIWNKDEKAFLTCQKLLDKYHAPATKNFVTKVHGSRGIVLHEFYSEDFN